MLVYGHHIIDFPTKKVLHMLYLNARSVNKKAGGICNDLVEEGIDICAITETWLTGDEDTNRVTCGTLTPPGYAMIHAPRKSRRGGGVAIVHKNSLTVSKQSTITYNTFENMEVLLQTGSECVRLCVVYRPPSSSKPQFLEEFTKYLDELATMSGKLLVLGDFNIHMDNHADATAQDLRDLLYSFNLEQHVNHATHEKGHILDLVITREEDKIVKSLSVTPRALLDHHSISFKIPGKNEKSKSNTVKLRRLKNIDLDQLKEDIENSELVRDPPDDLEELVQCYHATLSALIDKHAPVQEKRIKLHPRAPWYNEEIQRAKQERRRAEIRSAVLHICCTIHVWSNTAKYTGHMVRIWESIFTYILYISCVYQMQQKLQATWCSDAVIFFATFFVVVCLFVCFCCFFNTVL